MIEIENLKKLEKAGFTRNQAETQMQVIGSFMKNNATKLDIKSLREAIENIDFKMDTRFAGVDTNFKSVHKTIQNLEHKMDAKFCGVDTKFESVHKTIQNLEHKMDTKFSAVDTKFESVESRFKAIDIKFSAIDDRFDALTTEVKNIPLRCLLGLLLLGGGILTVKKLLPGLYIWIFN